ncbi:hypothetical protein ACFTAO_15795 [Paenibacillus rhizoplanae]
MNEVSELMKLTVYTRIPNQDYTGSLSNSVHMACTDDHNEFQPLNRNYGILFAVATVDEKSVIHEKKDSKKSLSIPHTGRCFRDDCRKG